MVLHVGDTGRQGRLKYSNSAKNTTYGRHLTGGEAYITMLESEISECLGGYLKDPSWYQLARY